MNSKNYFFIRFAPVVLFVSVFLYSCDEGLVEMNENPTVATELSPEFLFTRSQLTSSEGRFEAWRGNLIHASTMIQHLASTTTAWSGDRYTVNDAYISAFWNLMYENPVKLIEDIIDQTKDDPDRVNQYNQARILRVFIYHRLTDLYGDIPYFAAGKGFIEGDTSPAYDPQEEIYKDMINELTEAVSSMNPADAGYGANDLLYGGDVAQWRKFGNSLKMRLGMRLTNVDPALARSIVEEAASAGVMESNDDTAWINHASGPSGINRNGVGEVFQDFGLTGHAFRLSDTLVDIMKDAENGNQNIDPRLTIFGKIYTESGDIASSDPMDYEGLDNGLDAPALGELETIEFPIPNRELMVSYSAPNLFLTYGEVRFLLAEAAERGWNVSGTAQEHYQEGIRAAMRILAAYGEEGIIPEVAIENYVANVPPADLEQINTQKWIALYLNGYEAYANWRRTGYPELVPVDFPGNQSNGTIPRRLMYPNAEESRNKESYDAAVSRQGPDEFTTRMWWDAQ